MKTVHAEKAVLTAVAAVALVVTGCNKENASTEAEVPAVDTAISAPVAVPAPVALPPAVALPAVIVTVNGKELKRADMMEEMAMFTASPQFASMPPQQAEMIRKQMESRLVDRFVNQQILSAEADKQEITVTDKQIDEMITEIRGTLPPGATLEQIMEERKMDTAKLREDIGTDIRIRSLLEKQTENVTNVTDEAVAAFYEENKAQFNLPETAHARHILLKVEADADEAAKTAKKAKIEGFQKELAAGTADFEELAKANSDCPSGQRGGDLGSFGRGQMVPSFEEAAFGQEIDAIGPVIETQFGFHIIQVLERTAAGERSLEDMKDEISEQLEGQGKQKVVEAYLTTLREKADIKFGDQ